MKRLFCLAAVVLILEGLLMACGPSAPTAISRTTTVSPKALLTGTWTARAICPTIRAEINKQAPWAVQADNTNRACVIIGQAGAEQNVGAIVDLTGGRSKCPDHLSANTHATQVSGLGWQACLVTHTSSSSQSPVAVAEWGITFNAQHSIDINCSNQTNSNLAQLMPACRMVLNAVLASLHRN